jgi:hypothetical protein
MRDNDGMADPPAPSTGLRLRRAVVADVMRGTMGRVALGAAAGWTLAAPAYLRVRQSPLDPLVFLAIPTLLVIVALVAGWWPARRAARIDPLAALRVQ